MNFSGYVQLRRGILEHLMARDLSIQEYVVFTVLVMLADKSSGRGTINAPVLRFWVPELSQDAAQRALEGLAKKGYIFRLVVRRSPKTYPYWVDGYIPTTGSNKLRKLSISEAIARNDVKYITYLDPAVEGAVEGADYNKGGL